MIPPLKHELIKFADLVECFRHGNALLSLSNISVDGVQLNPEWSGSLVIDSHRKAKIHLLKGCFSAIRNPLAHEPKLLWQGIDDAVDYLTLISMLHRKLDNAVKIPTVT